MSLFSKLYGKSSVEADIPKAHLGRFSDAYKVSKKYTAWDESLQLFENGEYENSFIRFFEYLRDDSQDNVKVWKIEGGIAFSFLQGSKQIFGTANAEVFQALAKIVRTENREVQVLRPLISQNIKLNYGRFCLDSDGDISIVFDTFAIDASPYKLYYALKEIALAADKRDDLLLEEFAGMQPIQANHTEALPEKEIQTKTAYYRETLESLSSYIKQEELFVQKYPGALTYKLMDAAYRLDYLVRPEGFSMDTLECVNRHFFSSEETKVAEKNRLILKEMEKLMDRSEEEVQKEIYKTYATFGITNPCAHDRMVSFIEGELNNLKWYVHNGHLEIAQAGYNFIVGFILFNYAVPKPDRALLHLYLCITQEPFFKQLGASNDYNLDNGKLRRKSVLKALHRIVGQYQKEYPEFRIVNNQLSFEDTLSFSKSYLQMLCSLNLLKTK